MSHLWHHNLNISILNCILHHYVKFFNSITISEECIENTTRNNETSMTHWKICSFGRRNII